MQFFLFDTTRTSNHFDLFELVNGGPLSEALVKEKNY